MPSGSELRDIAERRLDDAQALYDAKRYDGAYYLAGYAIECALKAALCKLMDFDVFKAKDEIAKPFHIHSITRLVLYAGLSGKLATDPNPVLKTAYSIVTDPGNGWSEKRRYDAKPCNQVKCTEFLRSVKELMGWIRKYW